MEEQTIKIFGYSDDNIEVKGQVKGCDEYGAEKGVVVCEPSGDLFHIEYGINGIWRVTHERVSGLLDVTVEEAPEDEDSDVYTDTYTVTGVIERVRFGESGWPPNAEEIEERTRRALRDAWERPGLSSEQVAKIWEVLGQP